VSSRDFSESRFILYVPYHNNRLQHLSELKDNNVNRFSKWPTLTDRDRIIPPFHSTVTSIDSSCHFVPTNTNYLNFLSAGSVKSNRSDFNFNFNREKIKRFSHLPFLASILHCCSVSIISPLYKFKITICCLPWMTTFLLYRIKTSFPLKVNI